MWAAIGNVLKIFSLPMFLSTGLIAYNAMRLAQTQTPREVIILTAGFGVVTLVFALLFWNAKGFLISGNAVARFLAGLYMLLWIVSSLGLALLFIGLAYLVTSEPEPESGWDERRPIKPRFTKPRNWLPTGKVGPAGAMVYSNAEQDASVGIFDSFIPVQVLDRRNGLAHVVAATGEAGWIDLRSLTEGV